MTEPLPEAPPPRSSYPPVEATPEVARQNIRLGLGLLLLVLLVAGGAVGISFIYLHFV